MAGNADCFGRDAELATLDGFLDSLQQGPSACVIEGDTGIGRTALWSAGLSAATARSFRLLQCGAVEDEADLPYCALGDLVDGLEALVHETLELLPVPQRRALEVVLLIDDGGARKPGKRAAAVATLGLLRLLALREPVVVAVDDVHWLDRASARVLRFAVRRLRREPVGLLLTVEKGRGVDDPLGVVRALGDERVTRIRPGPLEPDALRRLVRARAGPEIPRATLLELERLSGGHPAIALELAAAAPREAVSGERLPVPERVRDLERGGIDALPQEVVDALVVVAALAHPTVDVVESVRGPDAAGYLRAATKAGVVTIERGAIRFAHPLTASVVYLDAPAPQRRQIHRWIADVLDDPDERARHLALAADAPDADVAAELEHAAARARARAALATAADLMELSHSLTPADLDEDIGRRALAAAIDNRNAGNDLRARRQLEELTSAGGAARSDALAHLCRIREGDDLRAAADLGERALEDPALPPGLRTEVRAALAAIAVLRGESGDARRHAAAAVDDAEEFGLDLLLAEVLGVLALVDVMTGEHVWPPLLGLAVDLEAGVPGLEPARSATFARARIRLWEGELDEARRPFLELCRRAPEDGSNEGLAPVLARLAQLEIYAGDWALAGDYAEEADRRATASGRAVDRALAVSAQALVAACRGDADGCRALVEEGLALAERTGCRLATRELRSTLGFLELSLGNAAGARRHLRSAADEFSRAAVTEPGALRFVPDAVEAGIAAGQPETAATLLTPFEERSGRLDRAWGRGVAARARALVLASRGEYEAAVAAVDESVEVLDAAGVPFEAARARLVRGRVQRRALEWTPARASLESALAAFDTLGARLWAEAARSELAGIGGSAAPAARSELSPSEQRVVDLVAAGRKNREVADALFMSLKTVEATLTRAYRKLGVNSRAELRAALARPQSPPN